jgi:hypothetical protein
MITYKINYHKGRYDFVMYEITEVGNPSLHASVQLKTNSLESLDLMVRSNPGIAFNLSDNIPKDIREMLLKYRNVL